MKNKFITKFQGYIDLTRAHFFPAWPILFCSGLMLAFKNYDGFSVILLLKAAAIGLLGMEAGLVLNDYVDRNDDKKDIDNSLTNYWRPFKKRPVANGVISPTSALSLFIMLSSLAVILIFTLPYPNFLYVLFLMIYAFCLEHFYQVKKKNQKFPWAQLLGRTDFALFPIAGYLCFGRPDLTTIIYFLFFYPLALAHLGINDLADLKNDKARKMQSVTVLYGVRGTVLWILAATLLHFFMAALFLTKLGSIALIGFMLCFLLLATANFLIFKKASSEIALKVLPLIHVSIFVYSGSIILDCLLK